MPGHSLACKNIESSICLQTISIPIKVPNQIALLICKKYKNTSGRNISTGNGFVPQSKQNLKAGSSSRCC